MDSLCLPRRLVSDLDLLADQAVEVVETRAGGAAAAAGIATGDLIVAAAGRIVASTDDLHRILAALPPSSEVALQVVRDERLVEIAVRPAL